MYCKDCQEQQSLALREVEELLTRLEAAEALFPSSQVLANVHPVYKSPEFVGRVKAMCLWYNITRHHRLKLLIVGKIFARFVIMFLTVYFIANAFSIDFKRIDYFLFVPY